MSDQQTNFNLSIISRQGGKTEATHFIGYYGCSCHPFATRQTCEEHHKRRFKIGDQVQNRCTGKTAVVDKITGGGFYIVCEHPFPAWPRQYTLEHAATLSPQQKAK